MIQDIALERQGFKDTVRVREEKGAMEGFLNAKPGPPTPCDQLQEVVQRGVCGSLLCYEGPRGRTQFGSTQFLKYCLIAAISAKSTLSGMLGALREVLFAEAYCKGCLSMVRLNTQVCDVGAARECDCLLKSEQTHGKGKYISAR